MAGGYPEKYRKNIVKHALAIYDDKIKKNDSGIVPLNRPKGYKTLERRSEKRWKKRNWANKGGDYTPIIIPSTPGGILCKMMREVAEETDIEFKVIEKGSQNIEKLLSKLNPTASVG